ncbi:hypothetical protein DT73_01860 [Mangrovibacter sp. MFB070]|nr:hypothetical protein DT73_01860 [Mangrovibacter sp. MFB070]
MLAWAGTTITINRYLSLIKPRLRARFFFAIFTSHQTLPLPNGLENIGQLRVFPDNNSDEKQEGGVADGEGKWPPRATYCAAGVTISSFPEFAQCPFVRAGNRVPEIY